ncbi:MAG: FAD-dependent oxidoreductase [Clostridiales bacterium]|nr:FAD-dependent oxidoreductase [Clostridiales bacterium]
MVKTYMESSNSLPVYDECDVLVVGGGSAGHSAAIAAARAGCEKIIIMERYGYFGGDVTGDYVLMVPALSWRKYSMVRGIQEEWFTRLEKNAPDAVNGVPINELDDATPIKVDYWSSRFGAAAPARGNSPKDEKQYLVRAPYYEPNQLKIEMDLMIQELPNIKVMLHCWGTKPIMDGNTIKGVIYESKEGRKAVMAKIVIDATGDGDIYSQTGASYFTAPAGHNSMVFDTALVWRLGGVDFDLYSRWSKDHRAEAQSLVAGLRNVAGYTTMFFPTPRNDVVWFNNWLRPNSCIDIQDIKNSEFMVRNSIRRIIKYLKSVLPMVFKDAYLYDISPQLGSRSARRLDAEYVMTPLDMACANKHDDVVAWHSVVGMYNGGAPVELPYRSILPKKVENLLCPGRHFGADERAISCLYLVPQCIGMGQAAGVAAAVALKDGTTTHNVNIKTVQKILCTEQDVPLPRQENTNPELVRELEEFKYGTMLESAKKIRAEAGLDW